MDLRRFEPGINGSVNDGEVAFAAQAIEKGAEVGKANIARIAHGGGVYPSQGLDGGGGGRRDAPAPVEVYGSRQVLQGVRVR